MHDERGQDAVAADTVAAHEEQARRTAMDAPAHDSGSEQQAPASSEPEGNMPMPQGDGDAGGENDAPTEDPSIGDV